MKKVLKLTTMTLIVSIISLLCSNSVSAKTTAQNSDLLISNNKEVCVNLNENIVREISCDNVKVTTEDRLISQNGKTEFRQSKQNIDIILNEAENNSYTSLISDLIKIQYITNKGGSSTNYTTDNSISVKITLTVDYNSSNDLISITNITTKLEACNGSTSSHVGSGVFIDSNELTYGQTGYYYGGYVTQTETKQLPSNACEKSFSPPGSWKSVAASRGIIGANQTVKLHRGNSSWSVTLDNNIAG